MEISTILGLFACIAFIGYALSSNIAQFWDLDSVIIVVGGSIGVMFIRYPFKQVASLIPVLMKTIFVKLDNPEDMIKKIISLSVEAKKNGILGLEKVKIDNPFLKKGVQLAIDGVEPELIESVLKIDIASTTQRHDAGRAMMISAGDAAPAFGMLGTLIGLVLMLADMDDPKGIGPAMAVAIITTFYGSLISNVFFLPMADKLTYFHDQEMLVKQLIVNGILSIANGDHPAVVQEKLGSFLNPQARKVLEATAAKTKV